MYCVLNKNDYREERNFSISLIQVEKCAAASSQSLNSLRREATSFIKKECSSSFDLELLL